MGTQNGSQPKRSGSNGSKAHEAEAAERTPLPVSEISEAVTSVRFGSVNLIIQDGRVIQIDTLHKKRIG